MAVNSDMNRELCYYFLSKDNENSNPYKAVDAAKLGAGKAAVSLPDSESFDRFCDELRRKRESKLSRDKAALEDASVVTEKPSLAEILLNELLRHQEVKAALLKMIERDDLTFHADGEDERSYIKHVRDVVKKNRMLLRPPASAAPTNNNDKSEPTPPAV